MLAADALNTFRFLSIQHLSIRERRGSSLGIERGYELRVGGEVGQGDMGDDTFWMAHVLRAL
jgi:hypothetical protein